MRGQRTRATLDNSLISRFSMAAALASLSLILFACPNPGSNDLVLSVVSTIPSDGATNFDPGQTLTVTFNKDLDPACLDLSPVTLSPNPGSTITLSFAYDSGARKLSIEPHPFLESNHTYTVSFQTSLKDSSGAALPKTVDLAFTTGDNLAGDIEINDGSRYVATSDSTPVAVTLITNKPNANLTVHIANSAPGSIVLPYDGKVGSAPTKWSLDPGEGLKEFDYQFTDTITNAKSAIRTATVVRDTVAPTVALAPIAPASAYFNKTGIPVQLSASANDANGFSCKWSSSSQAVFTPSATVLSPTITPTGVDGPYTVTLTVTDPAGNHNSDSLTITKDTVAPGKPTEDSDSSSVYSPLTIQEYVIWKWTASPDAPGDTFRTRFDTETAWSARTSPWGLQTIGYGTHTLTVTQVDAAGNQSPALVMSIVITPVIPLNGDMANNGNPPKVSWHDFAPGQTYTVHISKDGDSSILFEYATLDLHYDIPNPLSPGAHYSWYVGWPAGGRSPPADAADPYYHFSIPPPP